MRASTRVLLTAALVLVASVQGIRAQTPPDPSGHWEGTIQIPDRELGFEVDLVKNAKGELAGTFSMPTQKLQGVPLMEVSLKGTSIGFFTRKDQTFTGVLSADGKSITGTFAIGGHDIPFTLTRTGAARIEPPARIAAVGKDLEGIWDGVVEVEGKSLRFVLTIANRADGTAAADVVNVDEGGTRVPLSAIGQKGSEVSLDLKSVGGQFAGALNASKTELTGIYTQGPQKLAITFKRRM